jgi:hypothetical protein
LLSSTSSSLASECIVYDVPKDFRSVLGFQGERSLPSECIAFAQDSWLKQGQGRRSFLAGCPATEVAEPADADLITCGVRPFSASYLYPPRGEYPPCLNQDYVEYTSGAFNLVTDCFGVDPKLLAPKIKGESGFLHNALGRAGDAGIGQLTGAAIKDVLVNLPKFEREVRRNQRKKSCKILGEKWRELTEDSTNQFSRQLSEQIFRRCDFLRWPINPLRNILFTVIFYRILESQVESDFRKFAIHEVAQRAGLQDPAQMDRLRSVIETWPTIAEPVRRLGF